MGTLNPNHTYADSIAVQMQKKWKNAKSEGANASLIATSVRVIASLSLLSR